MSDYDYLVYTDGACIGNPGPGGWAAIIRSRDGSERILAGNAVRTTNNRMELIAALEALRVLPEGVRVLLRTDSRHLADAIEKGWAERWRAHGWKRNRRERAENSDLWEQLLAELERRSVRIEWVRSHNGDSLNERCDAIARQEAEHATGVDAGYESAIAHQEELLRSTEPSGTQHAVIECRTEADGAVVITDGTSSVRLDRQQIPELISKLTKLLVS